MERFCGHSVPMSDVDHMVGKLRQAKTAIVAVAAQVDPGPSRTPPFSALMTTIETIVGGRDFEGVFTCAAAAPKGGSCGKKASGGTHPYEVYAILEVLWKL